MVCTLKTTAKLSGNGGLSIYVPQEIRVDSQNPIQAGDAIRITVDGKKMVIVPA